MSNTFNIDDTTWNDLNMDEVLKRLDCCSSSVGKEYLKSSLMQLKLHEDILIERSAKSDCLDGNSALKKSISRIFKDLGIVKKVSFRDYIFRLSEVKRQSNAIHYILILLLLAVIALIFIKPVIGIIGLVVMFAVNISTYFAFKGKIEGYFQCIKYLCGMIICAGKLSNLKLEGTPFEGDSIRLKELYRKFAGVKRGSWLITNSVSGSLVDVIMEYVRMLFHVDLIKFNNCLKTAMDNSTEIDELYTLLGETELALCISGFRSQSTIYCKPSFAPGRSIGFKGLYHPLVKKPVSNSLETDSSILLTGSNASGKSTFLKSIAINQIFAQTIYTCLAEEMSTCFYKVISSMALNDNILNNESYFVVEVKSLKRILDEVEDNTPVMCFVDEVLRGTNTKERIAASTVILKYLADSNTLTFAATHDIELTLLLAEHMTNYHFSETVTDTVEFDYKLKEGPSTSRNAIKLLDMYGFDKNIVAEAERLAE